MVHRFRAVTRIDANSHPVSLLFITGLRGVAALVVAVGHIWGMVGPDHPGGALWHADLEHLLLWPWQFGKPMVWLFILISGFALYWSEEGRRLRGEAATSLKVYAWKRAWRILPTYYMAFAFGLLVVVGLGAWLSAPSPSLQTYAPVTLGGVISHVFLIQNFSVGWMYQIDPPLWSIAVEAQLYVLFPILLWAARRWGVYIPAVALVIVVAFLDAGAHLPLFSLVHWFMVGAVLAHIGRRYALSKRALLSVAAVALVVGFLRLPLLEGRLEEADWMIGFSCLTIASLQTRRNPLEWTAIQWLGERSYSLYAVHFPTALLVWSAVSSLGLSRPAEVAVIIVVGISVSLALSHWCYRLVESPSLRVGRRPVPVGGMPSLWRRRSDRSMS